LTVIVPDAEPATLAQPQWILQQGDEDNQHQRRPTHLGAKQNLFPDVVESVEAGISHRVAEVFLDAQQLVVLGDAIRARERTGLDLHGIEADGNVGNGRILGFAGAMRDHRRIAGAFGHLNRSKGFGQGADLVDLDQDRIGDALLNTLLEDLRVGDENVITDDLHCLAQPDAAQSSPSITS